MALKATFAIIFSAIAGSSACFAQDVPDRTMINTLKCEAGRVGQQMAAAGLPDNQKVLVTWKSTRTTSKAGGVGLKLPVFSIGGSGDLSKEDLNEASSEGLRFNLNKANAVVCASVKREIIPEGVGVYDCLFNRKFASLQVAIEQESGSTGCRHRTTLAKKLSGNLRLNAWGVDVGPSGSWGDAYIYDVVIAAPVKK